MCFLRGMRRARAATRSIHSQLQPRVVIAARWLVAVWELQPAYEDNTREGKRERLRVS